MITVGFAAHVTVALIAVSVVAWFGRSVATWLRQPAVIGEVGAGLFAGPLLIRFAGDDAVGAILPASVLDTLRLVAETGLALFLVGVVHELRVRRAPTNRVSTTWIVAGTTVPSMIAGALLGGWLVLSGPLALRGPSPAMALVIFLMVALSVTAVPVLARILADRGIATSRPGRLALTGAVVSDVVCWLLLAVAVGLNTGDSAGFVAFVVLLCAAVMVSLLVRCVLGTELAASWAVRFPGLAALLLGMVVVAVAVAAERLGLTLPLGAVLVGLSIPAYGKTPWVAAMSAVTQVGARLVPVYFVVAGLTVLDAGISSAPASLILAVTLLGVAAKTAGGYFGALLGNEDRWTAARIGAMVNTRGLTELVVLQAGYGAGLITPPVYLALVVMALVSTVLTGPLLSLITRLERRWAH